MQAIIVKYLGPTNTKPSRYKASCAAGSVILSYDYNGNGEDQAAVAMCTKMGWAGELVKGQIPNGDYVYTFTASDHITLPTPARA